MLTSSSSAARARLAACLVLSVLGFSLPARAWKPITHVYLAEKARAELIAQNGAVSLHWTSFSERQQTGVLGTWPASAGLYQALRDYPAYFRAGVLGPDAYPDMLFGQSVIHPATEDQGSDTEPWLRHLYGKATTPQEKAFVMGFLSHAAGDMFGHTFVNHYAQGPFNLLDPHNAGRHILTEGHVGRRTPFLGDLPSGDPALYTIDTSAVNTFIHDNMIDARRMRDGSGGNEVWKLTRNTQKASLPRLFTELRAGLEDRVESYYEYVRWLKQVIRENNDRCSLWRPGACIKAAYYKTVLYGYAVIGGLAVDYVEAWVRDINRGLRAWPATSTEVARELFMQTNHKSNFSGAQLVLDTYSNRYLCSMMGAPDRLCALSAVIEQIIDALTFRVDLFKLLKRQMLEYAVQKVTGRDLNYWKARMDPEPYLVDLEVPANPPGPSTVQQLDQLMWSNGNNNRFDLLRFAPAYNTYVAIKMSFLDNQQAWSRVFQALGQNVDLYKMMLEYDAPNGFGGQIMLGFIRSLDRDNQWAVPDRMFLAQDCSLFPNLFMQQTGDVYDEGATQTQIDERRQNRKAWCEGGNKLRYVSFGSGETLRDIPLRDGETLTLGTCGVAGAQGFGNTYLRLISPWGTEVAANDDACGGVQSQFTYTVPPWGYGTYQLRAGCTGFWCGGTAAWTIGGSFSYSANQTNSATVNYRRHDLALVQGQRLQLGTCGVAGASGSGDTYLRMVDATGAHAALNDDAACGGTLSYLEYVVPWSKGGAHEMRAGCFQNGSCGGTVSYLLTDAYP